MNTKQYAISSTGDSMWRIVNSTTLRGAKLKALRTYQTAVGARIMVAINTGDQYIVVAVKHGHEAWIDC